MDTLGHSESAQATKSAIQTVQHNQPSQSAKSANTTSNQIGRPKYSTQICVRMGDKEGHRWLRMGKDKLQGYSGVGRHGMAREGDTQGHKWARAGVVGHAFFRHAGRGTYNRHGGMWGGESGGLCPTDRQELICINILQTKTHEILAKENKKTRTNKGKNTSKKLLNQCLWNGKTNNAERKKHV